LDGVNLALVTAYATYGTNIYRELDSAVRAFRHGYRVPLMRLVAENVFKGYAGGNPVYYSAGQYVAVICSDYPLVLSGDLDSVTSPEGGLDAAGRFPNSTFVSVPNVGHVTALGDRQGCAAGIVEGFIRSGGTVGDTTCVSEYGPVRPVPRFVRTSVHIDPVHQGSVVKSPSADRRVAAGALYAAGDVMTRWWNNYSGRGVGLAGGTFGYSGGGGEVTFRLDDLEFVRDVAVTGKVVWNRKAGDVRAVLDVNGPGGQDGAITATWNDWGIPAVAKVEGRIGGHRMELDTPAP
jgi:hypothetical protein